jgi:hypothetical protein
MWTQFYIRNLTQLSKFYFTYLNITFCMEVISDNLYSTQCIVKCTGHLVINRTYVYTNKSCLDISH